jgi:hypothetical protein
MLLLGRLPRSSITYRAVRFRPATSVLDVNLQTLEPLLKLLLFKPLVDPKARAHGMEQKPRLWHRVSHGATAEKDNAY